MPENLKDITSFEIGEIVGTMGGMFDMSEEQEHFWKSELTELTNKLAKLIFNEAMNSIKSSADKLIQEKL